VSRDDITLVEASAVQDTTAAQERAREIVRGIARGGLAGIIVGFVVAGLGGRLAMRLAALLVPAATGRFTENGNRVGDITLEGTLALIVFIGATSAVLLGVLWVLIRPWLPDRAATRALVALPFALALGGRALVNGSNPDFGVLRFDPLVVAILLALVASIAPALAFTDAWLDRRMPRTTSFETRAGRAYLALALFGGLLGTVLLLGAASEGPNLPVVLLVAVLAALTGMWWLDRLRGHDAPARWNRWAARGTLAGATVVGLASLVPEVVEALGG
jgi:hypothetical protein